MSRLSALNKTNTKDKIEALKQSFQKRQVNTTNKTSKKDERFWEPTFNERGQALAKIKLLPAVDEENLYDFVNQKRHIYRAPNGQWFWLNCPTSIGKRCPKCEENWRIYKESEEGKKLVIGSKWMPNDRYICNIYVIKDFGNPANDGKVMLYAFPNSIKAKIEECLNGTEGDEFSAGKEPKNPFDFYNGLTLQMKIKKTGSGQYLRNDYTDCNFVESDDFPEDRDFLQKVLEQEYDLEKEFLAEEHYPSEDEILKSMRRCNPEMYSDTVNPDYDENQVKANIDQIDVHTLGKIDNDRNVLNDNGGEDISLAKLKELAGKLESPNDDIDMKDLPF